jgi:5-(carboxyamino)imidazole ribonucleotide synthase
MGKRVGILGAGQLGRMLALAGIPLGLSFRLFDKTADAPTSTVGELVVGDFQDRDALRRFAQGLDVLTFEFENVPATALTQLVDTIPVEPSVQALDTCQDRLLEKQFFQKLGIPTPEFSEVVSPADLRNAVARMGTPAVLKTRRFGYDGKGQFVLKSVADVETAWKQLGTSGPLILEQFVPFDAEVSLIAVRNQTGSVQCYPLVENVHRGGILFTSTTGLSDQSPWQNVAEGFATKAMNDLNYVGVMTIEFFRMGNQLLANEIAPRVHNSGHWTIEGADTSQFENHLRAVVGWPLGSTAARGPSAMINLVSVIPPIERLLAIPGIHVHLYGKEPRMGRKLGHATITGDDAECVRSRLQKARQIVDPLD